MFKKLSILVLLVTVVILPLNFANNLFGTTVLVAEAAASDFTDGKKIDFIEKIETGETGNYDSVWTETQGQSKAGTVIFKIKPSASSSWDTSKKLTLSSYTLKDRNMATPKQEVIDDYVLAYVYITNPTTAVFAKLKTQNGEYGEDPFEYEAVYVAGRDLTKPTSTTSTPTSPSVAKKVYWDGIELRKGQIGKININKPINVWKRDGGKLVFERVLKKGEQYRVYTYDTKFGGQYGLGGGLFVTKLGSHITYKTPPKSKLLELNN
ncbi:hypothetical protein WAX74_15070 [Psychrobacillus sp. FJAT-51614]|uniref:Uncharacterized protein n=1 Tax=Psychrobacillus mangrovi TaxID=3117745 RepID=A0ABU8F7F9_9BACI